MRSHFDRDATANVQLAFYSVSETLHGFEEEIRLEVYIPHVQ
jgi:hypothetical protein